jgi:flagellar biosynthesis GTPase FlhF
MPARIERSDERAVFRFTYEADLIAELKGMIAPRFRTYNPNSREWTVREPMIDSAIAIVRKHLGNDVVVIDKRSGGNHDDSVEELRAKLAAETARAASNERKFLAERAARISDEARRTSRSEPRRATKSSSASWAAELWSALPEAMREPVYKRLLAAMHPDTNNGNREIATELTKTLNGTFRPPRSGR